MKKTKTKKTPALTCGGCPHFDRRAGWCKVGATWRTADSGACAYGAMAMAKQIKQPNNQTMRKLLNALLGFAAGIIAMPLIIVIVPFAFAWWLYNETDGEDGR